MREYTGENLSLGTDLISTPDLFKEHTGIVWSILGKWFRIEKLVPAMHLATRRLILH